jgi:hypothetical protein
MQNSNLIKALLNAQSEFLPMVKNAVNPHFKNSYINLDGIMLGVREALKVNQLVITHNVTFVESKGLMLTTYLYHTESNESISSEFPIDASKPQEIGSLITYGKRYLISALLNLTTEADTDAEPTTTAKLPKQTSTKTPYIY